MLPACCVLLVVASNDSLWGTRSVWIIVSGEIIIILWMIVIIICIISDPFANSACVVGPVAGPHVVKEGYYFLINVFVIQNIVYILCCQMSVHVSSAAGGGIHPLWLFLRFLQFLFHVESFIF